MEQYGRVIMMTVRLSRIEQYLDWFKKKTYLDKISFQSRTRVVRRGEVYNCYLGRGVGSEEEKYRPCLIIQNDDGNNRSANTIVAPITSSQGTPKVTKPITGNYQYTENGITKNLSGFILLGNIVTISKARIGQQCLATLTTEMNNVDEKIMVSMGIFKLYHDSVNKNARSVRTIKKMSREINSLREKVKQLERK